MSVTVYLNLGTSYQELENLDSFKITQKPNEHGELLLTAIVQENAKTKYATEVNAYESVEIAAGEPENLLPIFKGILKHIEVRQINKTYYLFITAQTGSYRTDIELRSRSYQNKENTYKEIFEAMAAEYEEGDFADMATKGKKTERLLVQYQETDWEFLKRMASQNHTVLVPSLIHSIPKITVGKPEGSNRGEIKKYNYYVTKDLERFLMLTENGADAFTQLDAVTFYIEITENFEIGDKLVYYDQAADLPYVNLFIKSKTIEMADGLLRYRYELSTENGFYSEIKYNNMITGVSIKGVVLERIQDTVKVQLDIDVKEKRIQDPMYAWKFQYTTPYTANGNGGWYVMPEVGDTVLIYFPDKDEINGVGMQSVREKNDGTDKIGDPAIKYLRTANGKEIKLAPDEIVLTCSNGKNGKIYIQLADNGGIIIQSTKPVYINSDADINFSADNSITVAAENEIRLKCQSSLIKLDSSIEVISSSVKVN